MFISVDVGGTNIRVAGSSNLDSPNFTSSIRRRKNTQNFQDEIAFILEAARGCAGNYPISSVGICVPGTLGPDKKRLNFAQNLSWWEGKSFAESLAAALACDVYAEHDGVAAGLGEAFYGSAPEEFCYLVWGTGIGGAEVHRDERGRVLVEEIEWQSNVLSWENDCGGKAISQKYGKPTQDLGVNDWDEVQRGFKVHLKRFVEQADVRNIVLGGGLAIKHRDFLESLTIERLDSIRVSRFGDNSGLYGGFALIRQQLGL